MTRATRRDGTPVTEPSPSRGYSWPPFTEGNLAGLRHGAFSDRVITEKALDIRAALLRVYPYLGEDTFLEALHRYARAEARAALLHDYIMTKVEADGVESVKPYLWAEARGADALAQKCGQDCGLDPRGHAVIARDLGLARSVRSQLAEVSVAKLAEIGRRSAALREGKSR